MPLLSWLINSYLQSLLGHYPDVIDEVKAWQNRPLEEVYPILYLDALQFKVRDGAHVRSKSIYVAIGVKLNGLKDGG